MDLPWIDHWMNSKGTQNAPQETEIESYVIWYKTRRTERSI